MFLFLYKKHLFHCMENRELRRREEHFNLYGTRGEYKGGDGDLKEWK